MGSAAFDGDTSTRPKALVYRDPVACEGCPEAVAELLASSPQGYEVIFAGPGEEIDVSAEALVGIDVYAQPGGPDLDSAWAQLQGYKGAIQDFVSSGGYYLGFCLGAYLAGYTPGFELLPRGADADAENSNPDSQVTSGADTVIQVDWTFVSGETKKGAWMYFQDGATINGLPSGDQGRVIARYSKTGDVAAAVAPYGRGWVGVVGPHPEATQEWYSGENISNPDGVNFRIGYDFIAATLAHGRIYPNRTTTSLGGGAPRRDPEQDETPEASTSGASGMRQANPLARVSSRVAKLFHRS